ncbi:TPA: hypothetical protein HA225_04520 [Candidatus Micrarchaeota archaeon]|nr:hypothetical protein [Candidatus Micrarchaeota archaeon]HIH30182.1 hypothetical protein [Candidatus Micrarchaeota archaeon]
MVRKRHHTGGSMGKRVVYITPHRNLAVEVMKMYLKHGDEAWIERDIDPTGAVLFVVYIFPG